MTDKPTAHITYCGGCGYEPRALSIAADINREFGLQVDLFKTVGGVFEIDIGEDRIFSKIKLGRFPEDGEIMHILSCKFSKPAARSALASLQAAAAAWAAAAGNIAESSPTPTPPTTTSSSTKSATEAAQATEAVQGPTPTRSAEAE